MPGTVLSPRAILKQPYDVDSAINSISNKGQEQSDFPKVMPLRGGAPGSLTPV